MNNNILRVKRTIISIGDFELDAYTADEKDDNGEWINYLSSRGLASSIDENHQTVGEKYMSQSLKAKLGADFTMGEGSYVMSSGGVVKVSLWKTKHAVKYWKYHEKKGNAKAEAILEALEDTTLNIIINDAVGRGYKKGDAAKMVGDRILSIPDPWRKLYDKDVCRTVFKWMGTSFYWEFAYFWMTKEEICKLNELNPVVRGERSKGKIHQFISPEIKARLEPRIRDLCVLVVSSTGEQDFRARYSRYMGADQQELF